MDDANPPQKSALAGRRSCPCCGAQFVCGNEAGEARCWCARFPVVPVDPALPGCLCPACLEKKANRQR